MKQFLAEPCCMRRTETAEICFNNLTEKVLHLIDGGGIF